MVPVEPTPKMIDSTWNDQDEIETMSHNSRNEFIYKKMIQVAMVEAARAEMSRSDLWCVAIRPECDSHFEQCPAASKELAEKAVARYKSMNEKEGNEFVLEIFDYCFEVQVWEGSEEDHAKEMFYTESWFSEAMYWCDSLEMAERVFKFGEIVDCHKKGFPILKTSDFEKAKRFYEEAKADAEG